VELDLANFQREIAYLNETLANGIQILQYGSYADRHPGLGKMVKCSMCGRRRREVPLESCCHTAFATTQRIWTEGHSVRGIFLNEGVGKGFGPRTRHEKGFHQLEWKEWDEKAKDYIPKPRMNEAVVGRSFFRRMRHRRHSNLLRHQIHDMILAISGRHYEDAEETKKSLEAAEQFRNTTHFLLEGLLGFHEPKELPIQHIPNLAERVVRNIHKQKSIKKKNQQKLSRKINRRK
jgi:hypothetical protein